MEGRVASGWMRTVVLARSYTGGKRNSATTRWPKKAAATTRSCTSKSDLHVKLSHLEYIRYAHFSSTQEIASEVIQQGTFGDDPAPGMEARVRGGLDHSYRHSGEPNKIHGLTFTEHKQAMIAKGSSEDDALLVTWGNTKLDTSTLGRILRGKEDVCINVGQKGFQPTHVNPMAVLWACSNLPSLRLQDVWAALFPFLTANTCPKWYSPLGDCVNDHGYLERVLASNRRSK